ncbi:GNAT family N-acetyltransferase [Streptomyces cinerochromogenes]|uniref:GNAT family N-acetyltransferase n=1 Tax=Streptomyces cinerochromogenes TaxID=66422 RepID=UPI0016708677|nr:GNAT family N-acetyltransferase [Streptomyces cinerochromogenes]GGS91967.1 N-acetyltransferase GCN5 [Streptomyces cinerochromogenes]
MSADVRFASDEESVRRCWPLFVQLRPHLTGEEEFLARWARQRPEGYRIVYAEHEGSVLGAAGFRVLHTMAWGRILYLDDLVVDEGARGTGVGSRLLGALKDIAREEGCEEFHLDTGHQRHAAHRAYLRNGFHFDCHHLALSLGAEDPA